MSHDDPRLSVESLTAELRRFAQDRDWEPFHTPRNLLLALTGEVGELAEIFQWRTDAESTREALADRLPDVEFELADVLLYLLRLADALGVDLLDAAHRKIEVNRGRFPAGR